ncbi:hypothetical protein HOD61_00960 [archaeon]|jgi:hypothetical protein|nr:hypothetical protein [archaeon]
MSLIKKLEFAIKSTDGEYWVPRKYSKIIEVGPLMWTTYLSKHRTGYSDVKKKLRKSDLDVNAYYIDHTKEKVIDEYNSIIHYQPLKII